MRHYVLKCIGRQKTSKTQARPFAIGFLAFFCPIKYINYSLVDNVVCRISVLRYIVSSCGSSCRLFLFQCMYKLVCGSSQAPHSAHCGAPRSAYLHEFSMAETCRYSHGTAIGRASSSLIICSWKPEQTARDRIVS